VTLYVQDQSYNLSHKLKLKAHSSQLKKKLHHEKPDLFWRPLHRLALMRTPQVPLMQAHFIWAKTKPDNSITV